MEGSREAAHTHAVRFLMRLRWLLLPSQLSAAVAPSLPALRVWANRNRNDFHIPQQLKPLSQGENPIKFGSERNKSELSVK